MPPPPPFTKHLHVNGAPEWLQGEMEGKEAYFPPRPEAEGKKGKICDLSKTSFRYIGRRLRASSFPGNRGESAP